MSAANFFEFLRDPFGRLRRRFIIERQAERKPPACEPIDPERSDVPIRCSICRIKQRFVKRDELVAAIKAILSVPTSSIMQRELGMAVLIIRV